MTTNKPADPFGNIWKQSLETIRTYKKREGQVGVMDVPELYTSIANWKPVPAEQFLSLLHGYTVDDCNLGEHMDGLMTCKSFRIDRETFGTIRYSKKYPGSSVASPVLLTISAGAKLLHFASIQYGALANE